MPKLPLLLQSFLSSLGVLIYVSAVAWLMTHGERIFCKINNFFGPALILLLLIVSATITGALVLGRPIYLYGSGEKERGIKLFFYNLGWLIIIIAVLISILASR